MVVLAACTGGRGDGDGAAPSTTVSPVTSTAPPGGPPTVPSTTPFAVPEGSVTLRVTGLTLPDARAGGSGLRLVVRPAVPPRLTVRRTGGRGAVAVCPVVGATTRLAPGDCVDLPPDTVAQVGSVGGVELRATEADAAVDEVAVTYVPVDRSTTVLTPAVRPAPVPRRRASPPTP